MATPPRQIVPDYSGIAQRGARAGQAIQQIGGIVANTTSQAIQQYQQNRNLKTAYKGVRGMILDQQEKYGLNEKQADALMSRLKYRKNETIEAYEKRVAPILSNMKMYDGYIQESEYHINMPDPFMDTKSFAATMDYQLNKRKQKEVGASLRDLPEDATQEDAMKTVAGRMPGRAVSEEELKQFPGMRALPTQKDEMSKEAHKTTMAGTQAQTAAVAGQEQRREEMHPLDMKYKQSQINAMNALEEQRRQATSAKVKEMAAKKDKQAAVDSIDDFETLGKMELAAKELLKDIAKEDNMTGEMSEVWLETKRLSQLLSQKVREVAKIPETSTGAKAFAGNVQRNIEQTLSNQTPEAANIGNKELASSMTVKGLHQFAVENGLNMPPQKIQEALQMKNIDTGRNYTVEEVYDRIQKLIEMQKTGGRVGQ